MWKITASVSLAILAFTASASTGSAEPEDAHASECAHRAVPPKAVDTSEAPQPGFPALDPLPIPASPIGGELLATCEVIQPPHTPAVSEGPAHSWLIADMDSGKVLAAKNPHGRFRPASTIKTLLAVATLQALDPQKTVRLTDGDAAADEESNHRFVEPGTSYTISELLEASLMISSNGAANALARTLGGEGGVPAAIERMNSLAHDLGALDTRATTPSGVEAPGGPSTSSPYDLALIYREAMKQPLFARIVAQKSLTMHGDPEDFPLVNDNAMLDDYEGMLGGKTGYTDDSLKTFVGAAQRNGRRLIISQMYGLNDASTFREQAASLLDWGFALDPALSIGELVQPVPPEVVAHDAPPLSHEKSWFDATSALLLGGIFAGSVVLMNRHLERRKGEAPTPA